MTHPLARLLPAASLGAALIAPALASASVYPGCAAPPAIGSGNVHYVDPVHGSSSGDGTAAHPWHTLAEVVAAGLFYNAPLRGQAHINPSAPIQAGDTVYLMSGNHGSVLIQGQYASLVGYNNSSFITIAAAPGQTPVLSQLNLKGGSKWVFSGLTIQSTNNTGSYASGGLDTADYWLVEFQNTHSDIVFENNILSSAPAQTASQWTLSNWLTERASGVKDYVGTCVAIMNNSLRYVGTGIQSQRSTSALISGNNIDYFSDDGIDYGSNNMLIAYNTIINSVEDGDGIHRDGIQGQPYSETTVNSNITIEYNTITRLTDPNLRSPAYLQGIDAFDGIWTNMTIKNNNVITDQPQGISIYGVTGISITNNILLGDGGKVRPCAGLTFAQCQATSVTYNTSTVPAIAIDHSKAGAPSADVTIASNYASGYGIDVSTVSPNVNNNTCVLTGSKCQLQLPIGGVMMHWAYPGTYGNHNIISTETASQMFVEYNPITFQYNLALKSTALLAQVSAPLAGPVNTPYYAVPANTPSAGAANRPPP
jgi:Right handed beta helix region